MEAPLLGMFLVLVSFVAMVFSVYVLCFIVWHHARVKQYSSKLLLGHGILELIGLFVGFLGFFTHFRCLLLFFISLDFLLGGWILFDVLYGKFFYDGAQYKGVLSKSYALILSLWGVSHYLVGYYDWYGCERLLYIISGLFFLGLIMLTYILNHDMKQFKNLRDYVATDVDRVERSDRWKVILVSKQYKFLYLQFPIYMVGYTLFTIGLVTVIIEGLSLLATIFFCTGISLFTIGRGCQLMGFFYPVPQWRRPKERN